jgi:hypothetical protein
VLVNANNKTSFNESKAPKRNFILQLKNLETQLQLSKHLSVKFKFKKNGEKREIHIKNGI